MIGFGHMDNPLQLMNNKCKTYYPMFLGNGLDGVLIDWSGAMSFMGSYDGTYCYWYKSDRRDRHDCILPLIRSKYALALNGDHATKFLHSYSQRFDPRIATLQTQVVYGVSLGLVSLEVTTFLIENHTLVEHYRIKSKPAGKLGLALFISNERIFYREGFALCGPEHVSCQSEPENHRALLKYRYAKTAGQAAIYLEGLEKKAVKFWANDGGGKQQFCSAGINIENAEQGFEFTKYVTLVDNLDARQYASLCDEIQRKVSSKGYALIRKEHRENWLNYFKCSEVRLPDPLLEYEYHLSRYLIKAIQNPLSGSIPTGLFPGAHQGRAFWDGCAGTEALLKCNNIRESRRKVTFWKNILPQSRNYARKLGQKGARTGWAVDNNGKDPDVLRHTQYWNNGMVVLDCWNYFNYSGDKKTLRVLFPVIKENLDFLIAAAVEERGGKYAVKAIRSIDESAPKGNESWNITVIIRSIECLVKAAEILGKDIDQQGYMKLKDGLNDVLKRNYQKGVLRSFENAQFLTHGSIFHFLFSPGENAAPTLKAYVKNCRGREGLSYKPNAFQMSVWNELMTAVLMARHKVPDCIDLIQHALKHVNYFGGLPEWMIAKNVYTRHWHAAGHFFLVQAINDMLVHSVDDTIRLLPAIPKNWTDLTCRNIRVQPGILVSMIVKKSKITGLVLKNMTDSVLMIRIDVAGKYLRAKDRKNLLKTELLIKCDVNKLI